ncbi:hypothetical protein JCM11641_008287 [Rhodosporidiobolus odoratus]
MVPATSPQPAPTSGLTALLALRDQLDQSIHQIQQENLDVPDLNSLTPPAFSTPPRAVTQAVNTTKELLALLSGWTGVYHVSSAIRVVIEVHVTEQLIAAHKAGKPGLHVSELAKGSEIDPAKLGELPLPREAPISSQVTLTLTPHPASVLCWVARILRVLAAHYIFREIEPDVFANNYRSLSLSTGKSIEELESDKDWYSHTNGFAAFLTVMTQEGFKGAAFLTDTLLSPSTSHSYQPDETPLSIARGKKEPIWALWGSEEGGIEKHRFGAGMMGQLTINGGSGIDTGFPFASLPPASTIVDVGGGVGAVTSLIHRLAPHVNLVLQDLPDVIKGPATQRWLKEDPKAVEEGRIRLMGQDFFEEQGVKGAEVYVLSSIIHDWPDSLSIKILTHLSDAAKPTSRLVLIEAPYENLDSPSTTTSLSGYSPLNPYYLDMQMMTVLNGMERTEEGYRRVGEGSGWRLVRVWKTGRDKEGREVEGAYRHYEFELEQGVKAQKEKGKE